MAHEVTAPEVDPGVEDEQDEDGDESVDEEVHVGQIDLGTIYR